MQASGSLQFFHILFLSIWLFEFGMSFSMRLVMFVLYLCSEVLFFFGVYYESICIFFFQGVKIVFKVGLALLKYCHDDLVSI